MLKFARRTLLKAVTPISKFMGESEIRFSAPLVTARQYYDLERVIFPGCVLITRTKWAPTNLFIPGFHKHAAMYFGGTDRLVIEAVAPCVRELSLLDFFFHTDFVEVLIPMNVSQRDMQRAAGIFRAMRGVPYDFLFEAGLKAVFCSEGVKESYKQACPNFDMETSRYLGEPMTYPQHFADSAHFRTIWSSQLCPR